ncbi:BamA/TamA family outer membrane protein [Pedobacter panaciterrae]|uniref:BamA/TamA family outer membrane protein n=1 Tax=Pedobacter panaciterrae TaxID=363849 RepID=UPI0025995FBD|nr:BamA/TamA family outer membrane protein [uncultured Pedobacter sp.]
MKKNVIQLIAVIFFLHTGFLFAQDIVLGKDSVSVRLIPGYDSVGHVHRKLFGENYRKEYAMETKLPVIRVSKIAGGLKATERGGGFQTRSLRLTDNLGREWVLRSVQKYPEMLLPVELRETFVRDVLRDNMSAQHPFAALIVPVLAEAIDAPHSNPLIGWVVSDKNLGEFDSAFAGTVCLLEQREPLGKSDNTAKMLRKLKEDNNYQLDAELYLKLKCLDVLIGDWDRHEDQWRWKATKTGKRTRYIPVPRDRDQVFYRSDGKVQRAAQASWFLPMMQGYERNIRDISWFLWEGREINSKWFSELEEDKWNEIVNEFCRKMTDSLLSAALKKLPEPGYSLRREQLMTQLIQRRSVLPDLMNRYYHFFNRIVDIELSDKDENIEISGNRYQGMTVKVTGGAQSKVKGLTIYRRDFDPRTTREIRIYLHDGRDSLELADNSSEIDLRIVGGYGHKIYGIGRTKGKIRLYEKRRELSLKGSGLRQVSLKRSQDTINVSYMAKDLYKRRLIFPNVAYNRDDGVAVGAFLRFKNPGFRKFPFGNAQFISGRYSTGSSALELAYRGEWIKALGPADILLQASVKAPYTQNFFGRGNESRYSEKEMNIDFYRVRFNLFEISPKLRWGDSTWVFSAGAVFQHYVYDRDDNIGRLITSPDRLSSYDSLTVSRRKLFAGAAFGYSYNTLDNRVLPSRGMFLDSRIVAFAGLNSAAKAFAQLTASMSFYHSLDIDANFTILEKIGGGTTLGKPAFYQSQFLGGQDNLIGYRQYRFAGDHVLYNNLELRIKAADFVNYVLPGQLGFLGLYDVGRVWSLSESSRIWHHGIGAGVYFAPASLSLLRFVFSYSKEGWYPYFGLSFRY